MHLLIDLKSPEYLNLPQHFTVSRTLQRATMFHIIKTQHSKKGKFVSVDIIQAFLVLEIDGGECSASRHGRFVFKENVYFTTGIG